MKNGIILFKKVIVLLVILTLSFGFIYSTNNKDEYVEVAAVVNVKSIKLNKTKSSIAKGKSFTLKATISPSNSTKKKITWKSSNTKVATVDSKGLVNVVGVGSATITASIDGKSATCQITSRPYVITEEINLGSYTKVASYNSKTLKYRIQKIKDEYYTLIWVSDANKQINSAMTKYGSRYAPDEIINKEIKDKGYQKKGLVAMNASPFADGWGNSPCTPFVINKGVILRDIKNTKYSTVYPTIGITKNGTLKKYSFTVDSYDKNKTVKQQMTKDGIRNSFASFATILSSDKKLSGNKTYCDTKSGSYCFRKTVLCQVDSNNFVIFHGGASLTYLGVAYKLRDNFDCKVAYTFDGGASSSLYYKKTVGSTATEIRKGQNIPDMLYFVEQ